VNSIFEAARIVAKISLTDNQTCLTKMSFSKHTIHDLGIFYYSKLQNAVMYLGSSSNLFSADEGQAKKKLFVIALV